MGKRSVKEGDSLWLLLDTVCNAFGGILLIALTFALVANAVRVAQPSEELKVALTNAVRNVAEAEHSHATLTNQLDLLAPKTNLWEAIIGFSNHCARLSVIISNSEAQVATNYWFLNHPLEFANRTLGQLNALSGQITRNTNALDKLTQSFSELTNALRMAQSMCLTNELRLPKEHDVSKVPLHVLLRYNRVYFTRDPSNPAGSVNTDELRWTLGDTNKILVAAIAGRGTLPDDPVLDDKLKALDGERTYLVCWVYADSFSAFNLFRDAIQHINLDYGWMPVELNQAIRLSVETIEPPRAQ